MHEKMLDYLPQHILRGINKRVKFISRWKIILEHATFLFYNRKSLLLFDFFGKKRFVFVKNWSVPRLSNGTPELLKGEMLRNSEGCFGTQGSKTAKTEKKISSWVIRENFPLNNDIVSASIFQEIPKTFTSKKFSKEGSAKGFLFLGLRKRLHHSSQTLSFSNSPRFSISIHSFVKSTELSENGTEVDKSSTSKQVKSASTALGKATASSLAVCWTSKLAQQK